MSVAMSFHVAVGLVALLLYWRTLLARKGSMRHRRAGRVFLISLVAVALSVGPLIARHSGFEPAVVIQFLYLDLCLLTVGWVGWRAIRYRRNPETFRSRSFAWLGAAMAASGAFVLTAGLATSDPVAVWFSWIGLVFGGAMLAFTRYSGELHANWGLAWHLNAMAMLFNAVHGTLAFVIWRHLVDPAAGVPTQIAFQVLTVAMALALRTAYGRRFAAPLAFGPGTPAGATTA